MSERDAGAGGSGKVESHPKPGSHDPPHHSHRNEHRDAADGRGTMGRMLDEALGRDAQHLKVDPRTGELILPTAPDPVPGAESAQAPPPATGAGAGDSLKAEAPPGQPGPE